MTAVFHPACNAPFTSMHLDPRGIVRACCMNDYQSLGVVGDRTLMEIWNGGRVRELRDRLADGDFSLGCEKCAWAIDAGVPESAYLQVFSTIAASGPEPAWPRRLELALSNTCNLQCVMCNGDLSSSIRSQREHRPPLPVVYDDDFFDELAIFLPHLDHITFLGGEPFLGREPLRVFDMLLADGLAPTCHVTTNGTQWNDRVRSYIEAFPIHVAISIDALSPELAESIRVGVDHRAVLANIEAIRRATRADGKGCSISFCLMRQNWHELGDVLRWADERDLDVFVNRVTSPPRFGLALAPTHELHRALEALEAQSADLERALTRNLEVWRRELAQLRAVADQRFPGRADDDLATSTVAELVAAIPPSWAEVIITANDGQVIVDVDSRRPSPSVSFDQLVGQSLQDIVEHLQQHLGPITSTSLTLHPGGVERRTLRFVDSERTTEVQALLEVLEDGSQAWTLRLGEPSGDDLV